MTLGLIRGHEVWTYFAATQEAWGSTDFKHSGPKSSKLVLPRRLGTILARAAPTRLLSVHVAVVKRNHPAGLMAALEVYDGAQGQNIVYNEEVGLHLTLPSIKRLRGSFLIVPIRRGLLFGDLYKGPDFWNLQYETVTMAVKEQHRLLECPSCRDVQGVDLV